MEAKNFRVGFYLNENQRYPFDRDYRGVIKLSENDIKEVFNHNFKSAYTGILLNREWFKKYGFRESNCFYLDLTTHYLEMIETIEDDGSSYYYPSYVEVRELSSTPEQRVSLNRIRYVHELQNLFFALTGQELESVAETST